MAVLSNLIPWLPGLVACCSLLQTDNTGPDTAGEIKRIHDSSLVVLDLETTGLKASQDRILEVGLIRIENRQITARQSWLVNPGVPIPPETRRIHNISPEMVAGAPSFAQVYPLLTNFVGTSIVMSHHARFDRSFLAAEINRHAIPLPDIAMLDTLRFFQRCFPKRRSYALRNLTTDLCPLLLARNVSESEPGSSRERQFHSALWDAECTAHLLLLGLDKMGPDATVHELEKACGGKLPLRTITRSRPSPHQPQTGRSPDAPAE